MPRCFLNEDSAHETQEDGRHMNVLVIGAHPDDEVLGCGGTIARLVREGNEVHVALLGEGITSRSPERSEADPDLVKELHACSRRAGDLMGVKELFLYNLPDNRFDTVPLLKIVKIVEDLINRVHPGVVYTHHGGDLNIDHVVVHRAVLTATRPMGAGPVKDLFTFEVPSSTEWSFGQFQPVFRPNVFMDVTDTLEVKVKAMQCYESESRSFPHPRSPEALRAIARRWGSMAGCEAVEAFELVRSII